MVFHMVWRIGIDKAGRIVVPKPLRERLGFKPDTELVAIEQLDGVLLKRVEQRPSMVKLDGLWVHQGSAEPGANWDRIVEQLSGASAAMVVKAAQDAAKAAVLGEKKGVTESLLLQAVAEIRRNEHSEREE